MKGRGEGYFLSCIYSTLLHHSVSSSMSSLFFVLSSIAQASKKKADEMMSLKVRTTDRQTERERERERAGKLENKDGDRNV